MRLLISRQRGETLQSPEVEIPADDRATRLKRSWRGRRHNLNCRRPPPGLARGEPDDRLQQRVTRINP